MARGPLTRPVAAWLRRRFGIWVLYEVRNKALGWPLALVWHSWERRELRRLRRHVRVPGARVTTVIPTYRRPEGLLAAVHSALAQEVTDHTIVVVDDGGGLPELPEHPRLVAVALSRNTGAVGVVRNIGLGLARSEVVAFLDDDNTWRPGHLTAALAALDSGADLVYTGVERVRTDGSVIDVLAVPYDRALLADRAYIDANSVVLRSAPPVRFSRLPRSRATLPKEDWELVRRAGRSRRVVHAPEVTVRYLANPDSYYTTLLPGARTADDGGAGAATEAAMPAQDSRRNTST